MKIDVVVDYITVTTETRAVALETYVSPWFSEAAILGLKVFPWGANGYRGYTVPEGELSWGTGGAGKGIVRAWGGRSSAYWYELGMLGDNVSRIDLAVTAFFDSSRPDVARLAYCQLPDDSPRLKTLVMGTKGQTLYIGSRSSRVFLRLYDKGAKEGSYEPGLCWRYELEVKGPGAFSLFNSLAASNDARQAIVPLVRSSFETRGVSVPFDADSKVISIDWSRQTKLDKLEWFRKQVSPSVTKLLLMGFEPEVLEALGIMQHWRRQSADENIEPKFSLETLDS